MAHQETGTTEKTRSSRQLPPTEADFPASLVQCNLQLLATRQFTDVTFVLGAEGKEVVHCHSLFLMARSLVFQTMFANRWTTKKEGEAMMVVTVPDIESKPFHQFLQFVYADIFNGGSIADAIELLYVAHKYGVQSLVAMCEGVMRQKVGVPDGVRVYQAARRFQLTRLQEEALKVIVKNFQAVIKNPEFLQADEDTLTALLKRDDLAIKELDLFQDLMRWADNKLKLDPPSAAPGRQNVRAVLKNILPLVRFHVMSAQEFSTHVVPTNVLEDKEIIQLFMHFNMEPSKRVNLGKSLFSTTRRSGCQPFLLNLYSHGVDGASQNLTQRYGVLMINVEHFQNHEETLSFCCGQNSVYRRGSVEMTDLVLHGPNTTLVHNTSLSCAPSPPTNRMTWIVGVTIRRSTTVIVRGILSSPGITLLEIEDVEISNMDDTKISLSKPILLENSYYYFITIKFSVPVSFGALQAQFIHYGSDLTTLNVNNFLHLKSTENIEKDGFYASFSAISIYSSKNGVAVDDPTLHWIPIFGRANSKNDYVAHVIQSIRFRWRFP